MAAFTATFSKIFRFKKEIEKNKEEIVAILIYTALKLTHGKA